MPTIEGGNILEGAWDRLHRYRDVIPSADVLTMHTTPFQARAGLQDHRLVLEYVYIEKPAGTAYTLASSTQEIRFIYDSHYALGIDNYIHHVDLAGFLDQSTDEMVYILSRPGLSGYPVPIGDGIRAFFTDGDVTGGNTVINYELGYRLLQW